MSNDEGRKKRCDNELYKFEAGEEQRDKIIANEKKWMKRNIPPYMAKVSGKFVDAGPGPFWLKNRD